MANKRIRELDSITIGTGGTAASTVFLAVDPQSGSTSKVSLEDAINGTNAVGGGGVLGTPLVVHSTPARGPDSGKAYSVAGLFATNTTVFGTIFCFAAGGGNPTRNAHMKMATISKQFGSNSVVIGCAEDHSLMQSIQKQAGDPRAGVQGGVYTLRQLGGGANRGPGQHHVRLQCFDNGFFVHGSHTFGYQITYWAA
tara:strand:- start:126 stop:716 length:591 start_codon:yes stop_codon:yes gene_type:complete